VSAIEFHSARVVADSRTAGGVVVADGRITVRAETYGGENDLRWIAPLLADVYRVPAVGEIVTLIEFPGGRLAWTPWRPGTEIPPWARDGYPERVGIGNRGHSLVVGLDRLRVYLGTFDATAPVVLWPELRTILLDLCTGIEAAAAAGTHTHPAGTLLDGNGAACTGATGAASGFVLTGTARANTEADAPAAAKVVAE